MVFTVDMNIWLHQAVKSRGAAGGPRNYLAIFFRRLCKLLFFGIKPVFVFDGETPALKRSTMVSIFYLQFFEPYHIFCNE